MKTLDEVIDALQYWDTCDEFPESFYDFEVVRDALHYLRELQLFRETPVMQGIHKAQEEYATYPVEDWNPPLTWDELQIMEEKPVWVELCDGNHQWIIVSNFLFENPFYAEKYGIYWQAYRKERS